MNKDEVIKMIKRNNHKKRDAVIYISDFLQITKKEAEKIYREEFEKCTIKKQKQTKESHS